MTQEAWYSLGVVPIQRLQEQVAMSGRLLWLASGWRSPRFVTVSMGGIQILNGTLGCSHCAIPMVGLSRLFGIHSLFLDTRNVPVQPIGKAWLSEMAYEEMVTEAERVFPNETGGVFVGYWAVPFREVVVTAAIGPGPRAVHESERFIPDPEHQEAKIARCYEDSGRLHTYLGDWHTHPHSGAHLSPLDRRTLKTIARDPGARAPVPIMVILAEGEPWTLRLWRGYPIRIGPMMVAIRVGALTVKMFQP